MNDLEHYRQLAEFSVDGIQQLDTGGLVVRINRSGCDALGVADSEAARGKPWVAFWPKDVRVEIEAALDIARGGQAAQFTCMAPGPDGEECWWLVNVHPFVDADGRVDGLAAISRDVTEDVQATEALDAIRERLQNRLSISQSEGETIAARNHKLARQLASVRLSQQQVINRELSLKVRLGVASAAQAVAEHAARQAQKNEAIGQLVAGISHDFNNMLQIAIVALSTIQDDPHNLTETQRRLVGYSMDGVNHASVVAKRLLAFARVHRYKTEEVDLTAIIGGIGDFVRHSLGATIDFSIDPSGGASPTLSDKHSIEQAFMNLCINARDACNGQGAIRVHFGQMLIDGEQASTQRAAGDYVTVSVADNGAGMSEETRERLFEPYFTTKDEGIGTGLGLAQVYGVVRHAGGFVDVESALGQGSTVTLAFPRLKLPSLH
ncbi:MAG: ATP-binding protein [Pseudomonadota bacterium]|jgi:PAS domain S-box-containing protein|uniref:PAS domain-containing sensor histidine kinase n=1 Tax=Rhodanobacter sp. OK091 TaxID=1881037 RepID=UPI0009221B03|nr:PAS domain-containing sensor histidine kinase [Rhodanobacter sp. OK091]SHL58351.1 PAS domain S-box-containing protein [Rhodanobacter sp. OK091]